MLYLLLLLPAVYVLAATPNLQLLDCFEYKKNYWLVGHAFHTSSVQFKDECLRLCLSAALRGSPCLSAMHIPGDDECVISDQNQLTRPDLFVENDVDHSFTVSYYRNTCIDPPEEAAGGGRLEARLMGFQGGQGLLELSQRKGANPRLMLVMNGLKANKRFDVVFAPLAELSSCFRANLRADQKGQRLASVESDYQGMAIQPWKEVDFHILDDAILNKVIIVVESNSSTVVDCGKLQIRGNVSDWEAAKNSSRRDQFHIIINLLLVVLPVIFIV